MKTKGALVRTHTRIEGTITNEWSTYKELPDEIKEVIEDYTHSISKDQVKNEKWFELKDDNGKLSYFSETQLILLLTAPQNELYKKSLAAAKAAAQTDQDIKKAADHQKRRKKRSV